MAPLSARREARVAHVLMHLRSLAQSLKVEPKQRVVASSRCRAGSCTAHFIFGGRTRSHTPEAARASDTTKSTIEAVSIELLQQTPPSNYLVTSCRFFNCESALRLGGMLLADMGVPTLEVRAAHEVGDDLLGEVAKKLVVANPRNYDDLLTRLFEQLYASAKELQAIL